MDQKQIDAMRSADLDTVREVVEKVLAIDPRERDNGDVAFLHEFAPKLFTADDAKARPELIQLAELLPVVLPDPGLQTLIAAAAAESPAMHALLVALGVVPVPAVADRPASSDPKRDRLDGADVAVADLAVEAKP